jgi:hypothetical protein
MAHALERFHKQNRYQDHLSKSSGAFCIVIFTYEPLYGLGDLLIKIL